MVQAIKDSRVHDNRECLNVVLLGHQKSGKTMLAGNLRNQLSYFRDRPLFNLNLPMTLKKMEEISLARFGMNQLYKTLVLHDREILSDQYEKHHINIATGKRYYHIIDTPGNPKYTRNKIKGVAQAEACMLVLSLNRLEAASRYDNEEELEQIKENLLIAQAMGIRQIIVVINQIDSHMWDLEMVQYTKL